MAAAVPRSPHPRMHRFRPSLAVPHFATLALALASSAVQLQPHLAVFALALASSAQLQYPRPAAPAVSHAPAVHSAT